MSQPLTIQISDAVFQSLQMRAHQLGKTPELVAAECVAQSVAGEAEDPLMKWRALSMPSRTMSPSGTTITSDRRSPIGPYDA